MTAHLAETNARGARFCAPQDGSLATAVAQAESASKDLRNVSTLQRAARSIIAAAASTDCECLVAASASAESLVAAATLVSDGGVTATDRTRPDANRILVVDTATVSGNITRSCAKDVRANGSDWVGVWIYHRVRPDLDRLDTEPAIDKVVAAAH